MNENNRSSKTRRRRQLRAYYRKRCIMCAIIALIAGLGIGVFGGWHMANRVHANLGEHMAENVSITATATPVTPTTEQIYAAPQAADGKGGKDNPFRFGEVYSFSMATSDEENTLLTAHMSVEDFLTSQYYEGKHGDEYRLLGTEGAALLYIDTSSPFDTSDALEIGIETASGLELESYALMDAEISGNESTKVSTGKTNILFKRFKYEDSDLPLYMTLTHTSNGQLIKAFYLLDEPRYPIEPAVTESPTAEPMPTPTIVPYSTLEYGSRGSEVQSLQQRLIALGYLQGEADGIFGGMTQKAIQTGQEASGMSITGIADAVFQAYLYSDNAIAKE